MSILRADQSMNVLNVKPMNPIPEVTRITCLADAGAYEVQTVTFLAFASCGQGDYLHIINKTGTKFAVWLDKDNNGTSPTGALYVASDYQVEVDIVTGDTAAQVAAKVKAAIELNVNWAEFTITNPSAGVLVFTSTLLGNLTNASPKNTGDTGAGSIVVANTTAGVASNLQNKYFIMRNPTANVFNAWMNVSGEGVNPNPTGTEIECACTNGSTAAQIAASMATAINANSNFKAWVQDDYLYVANEVSGTATDVSAGDSGFTITKIQDGKAGYFYPSISPSSLSNEPGLIS